jgi:hypothetical protein
MKKAKIEHYSILKMILRIVTLGIAVWALVLSYQNKQKIDWIEGVQDNVIETLMFNNFSNK